MSPRRPHIVFFAAALLAVALFAPSAQAAAPTVTIDPASQIGVTSAHISGTVDPGAKYTTWHFEYATQQQFDEAEWVLATQDGFGESEAEGPQPAEANLNLEPGTTYHLRLVASNDDGEDTKVAPTFETEAATAPVLATAATEAIGYTLATLRGSVDPQGGNVNPIGGPLPIEWYLQYGPLDPHTGELEYWENGGSGLIEGSEAESGASLPIKAELPPGTLHANREYELRVLAFWLGGAHEALSPEPFEEFETKTALRPTVVGLDATLLDAETGAYRFASEVSPGSPRSAAEIAALQASGDPAEVREGEDLSAAYLTHWRFQCDSPGCGTPGGEIAADDALHPVEAEVTGLQPNTPYTVKLIAENLVGENDFFEESFTTPALAPGVAIGTNTPIGDEEVELRGYVNSHNSPVTDCAFEYGEAAGSYSDSTACVGSPAGNQSQEVTARLTGLTPGATYHFRLTAQTADGGGESSEDGTFQVQSPFAEPPCENEARRTEEHSTYLPDCRAYEQVSPPQKNGGEALPQSSRVRVASDGSAATFGSLNGFGDALGAGIATDYESVRGPSGWSTHSITPPQAPMGLDEFFYALEPHYEAAFSSDLSRGVFLAGTPLTGSPASVADVSNLYLRDDLRTPGAGSYRLLSTCPLCEEPGGEPLPAIPETPHNIPGGAQPRFAGASADYEQVVFESQQPLLEGFAGEDCSVLGEKEGLEHCPGKLYESDSGALRLVGLVPPSGHAACTTACEPSKLGSQAGQGAGAFQGVTQLTPHVVSADGSRVFFAVPNKPKSRSGTLYLREDATRTVQLNVSEREGANDVPSSESATYWDASADGSRVFFTTTAALTDDAEPGVNNLYMYDVGAPAGHHLTLTSASQAGAEGGEVVTFLGASADGRYAYFSARGQLVAGLPATSHDHNLLFVWHDGTVHYIAPVGLPDDREDTNTQSWSFALPTARVTLDGQHLLFSSTDPGAGPTRYDQGQCHALSVGCREFYLYSYPTQRLSCVTCNPNGGPASASAFTSVKEHDVAVANPFQSQPLSDDGRHVFFSTEEALVPRDTNGVPNPEQHIPGTADVYEYDTESGTVHLLSSGTDEAHSYFMNASPDGSDATFVTRQRLLGSDTGNDYDLYDARVDGGFSEPPPKASSCEGDTCHPGPQAQSLTPSSATANVNGPGNPPIVRCGKGRVRRHGRCLKAHSHHRRSHRHRAANPNRRTSR